MTITRHDFNKIAKGKREAPFSLRLTFDERAKLEAAANGVPLAAYIKARLFDGDLPQVRRRNTNPVEDLIRPEAWNALHAALVSGTAVSEWDRLTAAIPEGNFVVSGHALAAPAGSPLATSALLTTSSGGVAPFFEGLWGSVDVVRDPFSDAASGGLRITALGTMDLTVARGVQLQIMTGLQ